MDNEQLTLLNHATQLLTEQAVPFELGTETAARLLGVSPTTLNKAKNSGKLPYTRLFKGVLSTANFVGEASGKDQWRVYFKIAEDSKLGKNKASTGC